MIIQSVLQTNKFHAHGLGGVASHHLSYTFPQPIQNMKSISANSKQKFLISYLFLIPSL